MNPLKPNPLLTHSSPPILRAALVSIVAASVMFAGCEEDEAAAGPIRTSDAGAGSDAGSSTGDAGGRDDAGGSKDDAGAEPNADSGTGKPPVEPEFFLKRASKSGTIDITVDDAYVAMVLPDVDSLAIFEAGSGTLYAQVETGDEPSAVVLHPDGQTAFVANRADATVVRIDGIDTPKPSVSIPYAVGSEPTGLALSPGGSYLYVAEFAEGRVSVFDTYTMTEVATLDGPEHPYGLAVTNDGDEDESDETLIVPEFFGEPLGDETTDDSRLGKVRLYGALDFQPKPAITFQPRDSGFAPAGSEPGTPTVFTSPNQLISATVQGSKLYVPSVSASPAPPVKFNTNVFPVMYVADLESYQEDLGAAGTVNLAEGVRALVKEGDPRLFLADLVDVAFVGDTSIAYALSRGADAIQRLVFEESGVEFGSTFNDQIDLVRAPEGSERGCQAPTGIVIPHEGATAYVNCWISRALGVVNLQNQSLEKVANAADLPTSEVAQSELRGARFFFTGRARWSSEAWSSCSSCHPGGLSDGITWSFGSGPRNTTSLDGSFSKGPGDQQQRIFNWTGIFDELHDFERNTRGVSGGLGAVTVSETDECGQLDKETPKALGSNLGQPVKEVQDEPDTCTTDFDDIEAWVKTIRPPASLKTLDPDAVAYGKQLFGEGPGQDAGNCVQCHSGPGFTLSRRFFEPSSETNLALAQTPFEAPALWPTGWNFHTLQIAPQPVEADPDFGALAPDQVACVLRNVGSFGIPGDADATDDLELRAAGSRAQGAGGYNIPSLYGMSLGAPYLHHGQARTLEALFTDPLWRDHLRAGNAVFLTGKDADEQVDALIQYILSIDAQAEELATPAGFDGCPEYFDASGAYYAE